ncbi:MAG: hypothetical protein RLZZ292_2235, partial [Bacteroidota bacterium]
MHCYSFILRENYENQLPRNHFFMKKNLLLYSGLALSITLLPTQFTLAQTAVALSSNYVLLPNTEVAPTTIRFTPLLHATQDKSLFEV